jgi:hypothetical protein
MEMSNELVNLREKMLNRINQGKKVQHVIKIDFSDLDPRFVGNFVIHKASNMERLNIGRITSALKGGDDKVDNRTHNIATIIATLEVLLDEKPDWFDVFDPEIEYEILEEIYAQYLDFIGNFRNRAKGSEPTGDSENKPSEV